MGPMAVTRNRSWLVTMACLAGMCSLSCVANAESIRFVVQDRTLHRIDPRLFGQFMERPSWGETGPECAVVPSTNTLQPSVLRLLREMKPKVLRFPGGTDIDFLDWRDMVSNVPGRGTERPVSTGHTGQQVTNRFGYDEFLRLSEELGSEPIIVVNFREGLLRKAPLEQAARHAAGLVAYCNSPVGAKLPSGMPDWPLIREKNGRARPYNVKYWQIGNETWFFVDRDLRSVAPESPDRHYVDCLKAYVQAMREVDPSIRFIIDGVGSTSAAAELARKELGDAIAYTAIHSYTPWAIAEVTTRDNTRVPIDKLTAEDIWNAWIATPAMDPSGCAVLGTDEVAAARRGGHKLAMTEWNWNGWWQLAPESSRPALDSSWAKGVGAAGYLHALMRAGDVISVGCQSMLVGSVWGITAIHADPTGTTPAYYMPSGQMTMFYDQHHGDRMLALESSGVPVYDQPYRMAGLQPCEKVAVIDAVATRSDRVVYFHAINRHFERAIEVDLDLSAFDGLSRKAVHRVVEGRLTDPPGPGEPAQIGRTTSREIALDGRALRVTLPARSVSCIEVSVEERR